jgi:FKBP-type peptidyl-prolyl cis-trans isomerase FkpA
MLIMKNLKTLLFLLISLPFVLASCINVEESSFTAEKEQTNRTNYINNLISKGYNVDTTALGVYYIRLQQGTGDLPAAGDTISVKYVGYLMDGSIFDTSFYNSPDSSWTYVYKTQQVIASWDDATGLMNKGCKMEFIIPSHLAYGATGSGVIPPYSTLIFVCIMNDIRKHVVK